MAPSHPPFGWSLFLLFVYCANGAEAVDDIPEAAAMAVLAVLTAFFIVLSLILILVIIALKRNQRIGDRRTEKQRGIVRVNTKTGVEPLKHQSIANGGLLTIQEADNEIEAELPDYESITSTKSAFYEKVKNANPAYDHYDDDGIPATLMEYSQSSPRSGSGATPTQSGGARKNPPPSEEFSNDALYSSVDQEELLNSLTQNNTVSASDVMPVYSTVDKKPSRPSSGIDEVAEVKPDPNAIYAVPIKKSSRVSINQQADIPPPTETTVNTLYGRADVSAVTDSSLTADAAEIRKHSTGKTPSPFVSRRVAPNGTSPTQKQHDNVDFRIFESSSGVPKKHSGSGYQLLRETSIDDVFDDSMPGVVVNGQRDSSLSSTISTTSEDRPLFDTSKKLTGGGDLSVRQATKFARSSPRAGRSPKFAHKPPIPPKPLDVPPPKQSPRNSPRLVKSSPKVAKNQSLDQKIISDGLLAAQPPSNPLDKLKAKASPRGQRKVGNASSLAANNATSASSLKPKQTPENVDGQLKVQQDITRSRPHSASCIEPRSSDSDKKQEMSRNTQLSFKEKRQRDSDAFDAEIMNMDKLFDDIFPTTT